MSNINKVLITIVSCVFMICVASVSIVSIVTSDKNETTTTPAAPPSQYSQSDSAAQSEPTSVQPHTSTSAVNTTTAPTTTTAPSTTAASSAVTGNLATDILGKWTDSSGLSGYEFLEGGKVNWTYADLGQFGVPFDGYASGLYSIEGDTLTVKFSIYTATIKKVYRVSVSGNELSMYDLEEFETSTYARAS